MTAAVLYVDAVKVMRQALLGLGVTVTGERVPPSRSEDFETFLRVRRSGGVAANIVADSATILIESWAADEEAAMALAQRARQALHAVEGAVVAGSPVYRVGEFSGPGQLPDPVSGQPRVSQTFSITIRGS